MVLKELADVMMKPVSVIFKKSWTTGEMPKDWRCEKYPKSLKGIKAQCINCAVGIPQPRHPHQILDHVIK